MPCEHRIDVTGKLLVTFEDGCAQFLVAPLFTQSLELVVKVEYHDRDIEPTGRPRSVGVHANNEEGLSAEA